MKRKIIFLVILVISITGKIYAQNSISGTVTDAENGESVIGCNVTLQGTTMGNVTDLDGKFEIKNIVPGTYNIVFSFISYDKHVEKVTVTKNSELKLRITLKPSSTLIQDVVVTASRRTDTELSMLASTKQGLSIANGITSQQIQRSQDKDASEVIRRIPGVSIRDGKFVIVRGLTERYNSVWLNGASTPSSESDVRAFSFDVIPSGQIDNILIYKTPAPELPADFAGAMINIKSKSLIDRNSISFSYSYGYHQGTTYLPFYSYEGSKTDFLGYDKTVRIIPSGTPGTSEYKELFNQITEEKKTTLNTISKSFNTIMTPDQQTAKPDADFQLAVNSRFRLGDISVGTINAFGYNSTNTSENNFRAAYVTYPDTSYRYVQNSFASKVRISALSNWLFTFANNQKIEFRNLFNNYGMVKTVLKEGYDFYTQSRERSYELGYESRTTYSGQLAGNHTFLNDKIKLDWILGYSYANKNQPDLRRIKTTAYDAEPGTQYMMNFSSQGAADALGRIFLNNEEQIYNAGFNYSQRFKIAKITPEIKAGAYFESKQRTFSSRIFNYVKSGASRLYFYPVESYNGTAAFDQAMFNSINDLFTNNIDYKTGLVIREVTQAADSYNADNSLSAGYLAVNLPLNKWLNVYMGLRAEHNKLELNGFKRDGTDNNPINVVIDSLDFFPSLNATLKLSEKYMFRFASGKTINRPEFREVSPFVFYSFEDNATTYGNPSVVNSYITNTDLRFEWYPTPEELISVGAFYKSFKNPIESKILYTGSGWNYTFENAEKATSYGLEVDVRKNLHEFKKAGFFSFLKDFTFVINTSLIYSSIKTDSITEGASQRTLQGQSPYIINIGTYYQNAKNGIMVSLMYNKTGKRIATVGDINIPHVYEMPFNSLDLSAEKKIGKYVSVKLGVKNMLNDAVVFQQFQKYTNLNGTAKIREQITSLFYPGRQLKLGVSINL